MWWTRETEFGVKFSTFRKKLYVYRYVSGDSDHHPCLMQSTIGGEITRLLQTNSSVNSFEQEVGSSGLSGLGGVMMAKSSIESPRVTRGSPRKRWLEARRKSSRTKYNIRGVCVFPFSKNCQQASDSCTEILGCNSASQLWLALLHLTCSDDCSVSRGCKSDGRIKVESFASVLFFFYFGLCPKPLVSSLHRLAIICHQHPSEDFCSS